MFDARRTTPAEEDGWQLQKAADGRRDRDADVCVYQCFPSSVIFHGHVARCAHENRLVLPAHDRAPQPTAGSLELALLDLFKSRTLIPTLHRSLCCTIHHTSIA